MSTQFGTAISVIIPAYNESERLPVFLISTRAYLAREFGDSYEVIVVDDGSTDGTRCWLDSLVNDWAQLVPISHPANRGKGAAVRTGMLAGTGELMLFADADGATPIHEERRLRSEIRRGADVAIGSRLVMDAGTRYVRGLRRAVTSRVFSSVAACLIPLPVRDTQCGFKMFRRRAGRELFAPLTERGYLFDLELLALAARSRYRVAEVPVSWQEIPGSRLRMLQQACEVPWQLLRLRRRLRRSLG